MIKQNVPFRMLAAVATVLVLIACQRGDGDELDSEAKALPEPCMRRSITITAFPEDSVPPDERCRLVDLAIASVAAAEPSSGLVPADTAAIRSALVVPLSHTTPEGQLLSSSWHVTLSLAGRKYDAEIIVDRSNGAVTAMRIHKPF